MKVNFEIKDNYSVICQDRHIDLHNNFDFIKITEEGSSLSMEFVRTEGDWVPENEIERLTFHFKNITYKYIENGDGQATINDQQTLGEITFFSDKLRDINDSMSPQRNPKESDDLIFMFEDGKIIRLNCTEVEIKIED